MRKVLVIAVLIVVTAAAAYGLAGTRPGPTIEIASPLTTIGASTPLDVTVSAGGAAVSDLEITLEQNGRGVTVVSADRAEDQRHIAVDAAGLVKVTHSVGRANVPALVSGPARLTVSARRAVWFGLRRVSSTLSRDVVVRLEKPTVGVVSLHHYVNQGGAELVVYRVTPADVASGVRVGADEYPGYPASGLAVAGLSATDPALRVAFFALAYDQGVGTPIELFARDAAGNEARAPFDHRIFPKPAKASRIEVTDALLARVVPSILETTTEIQPTGSPIEQYLAINGDLRRRNASRIAAFAQETSHELLWQGAPFHAYARSAVESAFADRRTYVYNGREVDRQVHLGFDLASFANTPIVAAGRGKVLYADALGIYGKTVVVDHGLGVQSLYAHLSSIEVTPGAMVEKEQPLGRSGQTGLAGGDHLHFTMLVAGRMVNPVEWWDPHWIEDRILRKLRASP